MATENRIIPTCENVVPSIAPEEPLNPEVEEILSILRAALMGISLRQMREDAGRGEMLKRRLREVSRA